MRWPQQDMPQWLNIIGVNNDRQLRFT